MKSIIKFVVWVIIASLMSYGIVSLFGEPVENKFLLVFAISFFIICALFLLAVPMELMLLSEMGKMVAEVTKMVSQPGVSVNTINIFDEVVKRYENAARKTFNDTAEFGYFLDFFIDLRTVRLVRILVENDIVAAKKIPSA